MPELPEVETIRRALESRLTGLRVTRVRASGAKMRRPLHPATLRREMVGVRLESPRRRGKYLLLDTDAPGALLVHLGMSGRLLLQEADHPPLKHTHLELALEDGRELHLVDPRRFGFADWLHPGDEARDRSLATLGMEPLDSRLDQLLPPLFRTRRTPVKALLLDQRLLAGVGNIYATEALWRAGIRPSRPGSRIAVARLELLAHCLRAVLLEAIAQGGTTFSDYSRPDGNIGYFGIRLQVYGRAGRPCPACGSLLRRAVIGGRATTWCVRCQR